jgi:hypothetical protein
MGKTTKKTISEVNSIIKKRGLKWIGGEYIGAGKRTLICMDNDEYITTVSLQSLQDGIESNPFSVGNYFAIANLYTALGKLDKFYTILEEYKGATKKIKCKTEEGYIVILQPSLVKLEGIVGRAFSIHNPYSTYNLNIFFKNRGYNYEVLGEYKNYRKGIKCKDNETGYIVYPILDTMVTRNHTPRPFDISNPDTIYNIKKFIKNNQRNIELLSDEYCGKDAPLKCMCLEENCNHMWETTWHKIQYGSPCPKCSNNGNGWRKSVWLDNAKASGRFESFKVYKIRCYSEDEEFYKIGRTFISIEKRFHMNIEITASLPYFYEIIETIESDDGEYIWNLEVELHKKHKEYKYSPLKYFGGSTECFSKLIY